MPPTPEEQAARTQLLDALHAEWTTLDAPYQEALRLRFEDGLTAREIGQRQGCPTNTASWRVREGLKRLRERLDRRFEERKHWLGVLVAVPGVLSVPPPAVPTPPWTMKILASLLVLTSATVVGVTTYNAADAVQTVQPTPSAGHASASSGPRHAGAVAASRTSARTPNSPLQTSDEARRDGDELDTPPYGVQIKKRGRGMDSCGDEITELASLSRVVAQGCAADQHADPGETITFEAAFTLDTDGRSQLMTVSHEHNPANARVGACIADALFPDPGTEYTPGFEGTLEFTLRSLDEAELSPEHIVSATLGREPVAPNADGLSWRGSPDASVDVVACIDPDCPLARASQATMDQVLDTFDGTVRVAHLQNPLPMHPGADRKSRALVVAREHGAFWAASDYLHMHPGPMTTADFATMAQAIDLQPAPFLAALESDETAAALKDEQARCEAVAGRGSPTFFVEGYRVVGAQPFEVFELLLQRLGT